MSLSNPATEMASVYTDFSDLNRLKNSANQNDPEALKKAAQQFESLFVDQILQGMRQGTAALKEGDEDETGSSFATDFYQELFDHQISIDLTKNQSIGLAPLLFAQFAPKDMKMPMGAPNSQVVLRDERLFGIAPDNVLLRHRAEQVQPNGIPLFKNPVEFVKALWPYAVDAAKNLGVDPKVLLAQAALETRWGKSIMQHRNGASSYNLFGIKADEGWQKDRVHVTTLEYNGGVANKQVAPFRSYASFAASFQDYAEFLQSNPRYKQALAVANNPDRFAEALQQAGYATDPAYAKKIKGVFYSHVLNDALGQAGGE